MKQRIDIKKYLAVGLGFSALALGVPTANAALVDLCAGATTVTMPDGVSVPMWGFGSYNIGTGACTVTIPGPELVIDPADPTLDVTLYNTLTVPVSMIITGEKLPTQSGLATAPVYTAGAVGSRDRRVISLVHEAAPGGSAIYSWASLNAGSHIYHSATHQQAQVQMGLYGAVTQDVAAGEAYPGVLYDNAVNVFYSEIDPVMHTAISTGCFGMATPATCAAPITSAHNYSARYALVNGMPSDGVATIAAGQAGQNNLVRLFNAGLQTHMPTVLGTRLSLLAENGFTLPHAKSQISVTLHAMATADAIINAADGIYPLFDRRLKLSDGTNSAGMMSRLEIAVAGAAAPVAGDDLISMPEDTVATDAVATFNISGNDTPVVDIDATSVVLRSLPVNGSATNNLDGTVTYVPTANFNGSDSFTYTVNDTAGVTSNIATVIVTVTAVNDAPVAVDDAFDVEESTTLTIAAGGLTVNDSDIDGDTLTVDSIGIALFGTATLNIDGTITYLAPALLTSATDSFSYTVNDGAGGTATANVNITVTAAPAVPPTAVADSIATNEDTAGSVNVVSNDMAGSAAINPASVLLTVPSNGTASANAVGIVTYIPNANFNGTDSFTYTVKGASGLESNVATVSVTIAAVNDAPVALADAYNAQETVVRNVGVAGGVLANDSDIDGDVLTVGAPDTTGTAGSVSLKTNGSFSYTPAAGSAGTTDTFRYTVSDGKGGAATATVTMTIGAAPITPPTAVNDAVTLAEDGGAIGGAVTSVTINVWSNDLVTSAPIDSTTVTIGSGPAHGTATVNTLDGIVTYTPVLNYNGPDSFTYTVKDTAGRTSNVATVAITVTAVNDAPVAVADAKDVAWWAGPTLYPAAQGVLVNDSDVDGDVLKAIAATGTTAGGATYSVYADGSFAYTPVANNATIGNVDTFTYTVTDGTANVTATVSLTIIAGAPVINAPPEAQSDTVRYSRAANPSGQMTFNMSALLANDSDPDGGAAGNACVGCTIILVDANGDTIPDTRRSSLGSAISFDAATGILTYTVYPGTSTRNDRFWYHAVDTLGGVSGEATVTVNISR